MGEVGQALFEEAKLALRLGQYREAKTALDEAGRIAREEFGPRHINYASVLQMQAKLEREQGRPLIALPLLQEAIDILRNSPGCPDFILAGVLNNFGFANQAVGMYREAEKQFREAKELLKGSAALQSQQCYTATLANLAELYNEVGQDERAEPLLREALDVDQSIYAPDHPEVGTSMHNLGLYLVRHDRQEEGFRLLNQASKVVEKSLGQQSWQYAENLSIVARSLREARRYVEAETYCVFALETLRKSRPENSPDIAGMLTDLALVYACRGKFDQAEGALRKAVGIFEGTLPHHHKDAIEARFSLFAVLAARQKKDAAFDVLKDVIASKSEVMDGILRLGSEKERLVYVAGLQWHVDAALSFAVQNRASNPALVEWAFELILKRRGLAAEALSTQRDVVRGGANAELKDKLDRLNSLKLGIARQMLSPSGNADQRRRLETSQSEKANLERELAESIPEIGLQRKLQELDWTKIAAELAGPAALIEFVLYSEWHFSAIVARKEKLKGPERYAVFVLRGSEAPSVQLIDLGEVAAIDKTIMDFRACLTGGETRSGNATRFAFPSLTVC